MRTQDRIEIEMCPRKGAKKLLDKQVNFEMPVKLNASRAEVIDAARYYCRCFMSVRYPDMPITSYAMTKCVHWT